MNEDDQFIGDDASDTSSEVLSEEFAEQQAAEGEELYANGPAMPKKRRRGRPTKAEAAREKVRLRVERWRSRQLSGIRKKWASNLDNLVEPERNALLAQQTEAMLLSALIGDAMAGNPEDYLLDLFAEVQEFISRPGCNLVDSWITDLAADTLSAEQWARFDDEDYKKYGLRTRLWKLQYREFLRWITSSATVEPELASEAAALLAPMDPPKETKYVAEVMPFVSEADRERRIREKEIVQESMAREIANYERWQARQLGGQLPEDR